MAVLKPKTMAEDLEELGEELSEGVPGGLGRQEDGEYGGITKVASLSFSGTRGQNMSHTSKHA